LRTFRSKKPTETGEVDSQGLVKSYCAAIGFGFANPMTPVFFAATMPALIGSGSAPVALLALGVFLGSAIWWLALATSVSAFRYRLSPGLLGAANRIAGLFLAALAAVMIAHGCASLGSPGPI
jgi:threonine/homoserine/homoserine lactone efflux protein